MNLRQLFENKKFEKVINLFYSKKDRTEEEYIIAALAFLNLNKVNKAISTLKELLRKNPDNLDALFNLTTIYYKKKNWNRIKEFGLKYFEKDPDDWAINDILAEVWLFEGDFDKAITYLENAFKAAPKEMTKYFEARISFFKNKITNAKKLPKLAFICAKGLDNFINEIIEGLSENYWVRKFVVTTDKEIYSAIDWGDIIWFEWANEVAIIGSNYSQTQIKPVILRLHSYEALSYYPTKINWNNIDKLILVAEHIRDIIKMYMPDIENMVDIEIIPNGIDIETINFKKRQKGFNIAWVAHISHKKNPPMMLQIIKKLVEKDNRYKLHIAGDFQDMRYEIYLKHMVKEMNLENNVIFYGWVDDMDEWWEDKNYLLSTSVHEGHPYNIMEGMARGLKPVIHNYYGSKKQWPENLIFNTVDEAVNLIIEDKFDSKMYYNHIKDKCDLKYNIKSIKNILKNLNQKQNISNYLNLFKKNPDDIQLNELIMNYYLNNSDYKSFINFIETQFIRSNMELKQKISYFYRNLYYKFDNYSRFNYLSEKPFIYLENEGKKFFDKYYNKFFKTKNSNQKSKIKFLFILNGLDYYQILFRFVYEYIINSKNKNIEYYILSLLDYKSFNNADFAKKILNDANINFFIPEPSNNAEELIKQYYKFISEINPDISFYQSIYLAPYGILIFPLLKKISKLVGRHIVQDIEPYFDKKIDFVYTGINEKNIPNKNIFLKLPPVNSTLINKNLDIRKDYNIPKDKQVIISVGREIKYKNIKYWEVIKKLSDEINDIIFIFFGPSYTNFFKKVIPEKYIKNNKIILAGPNLNARAYLKSCDFYINSAPNGGGISFNEAYYAELPIITFIKKFDNNEITIENRVNYLPDMFYENAFDIFPKFENYEELYIFAKRIILDENFKNFIQSKRKISIKELEYPTFVQKFEDFFINLFKRKR
ncbi:glycosyltransferase [Marinitoga sp. 1138]|uniref:glycosyltransferase n=1 Tax=Marinitoga sp. 1138 TaxID=1643334 RepID=UPI001586B759|nr:glycosyltransferase [Marinitoga sp. 1138]NUU97590.1 hypothetical protein [Marinitoga sp. 1138]